MNPEETTHRPGLAIIRSNDDDIQEFDVPKRRTFRSVSLESTAKSLILHMAAQNLEETTLCFLLVKISSDLNSQTTTRYTLSAELYSSVRPERRASAHGEQCIIQSASKTNRVRAIPRLTTRLVHRAHGTNADYLKPSSDSSLEQS